MIETSAVAWAGLVALVCVATIAGLAVSRLMPWSDHSRLARLPLAGGLILAPFLTGLATVVALLVLPRAQSIFHVAVVTALLASVCLLHLRRLPPHPAGAQPAASPGSGSHLLRILLVMWCIALLVNSVFVPLTQNDSLEYATVGRLLYAAGTLDAYPALDPANSRSGFFGPWTHPPLYVSLIYLSAAIQGHANEPGLMRLIAPWFLLSATAGVVALGSLRQRNVGLLAGVLFLSTPLLFLGADSALIDALPVGGMVLLLVLLAGLKRQGVGFGVWLGLGLGLGLWSHSQAILFVPLLAATLLLMRGLKRWQLAGSDLGIALLVALAVAGWPYWKNIAILGTPISDNPAVFALRELDWPGYFRFARGLDTWPAIVQYGVLKGWFSLEAYGLNFWLMAFGLVVFWSTTVRGRFLAALNAGIDRQAADVAIVWLTAGVVVTYLTGVLLSALLGIDLMIRNDRYLLIIMPAVVIGAAYGMVELGQSQLHRLSERRTSNWHADLAISAFWIAITFALIQFALVGWYYRWRDMSARPYDELLDEPVVAASVLPRFDRLLGYWSSIRTMQQMAAVVPEDALVLTMRPADMYYSGRTMLSYLDPRLLPVYRATSATQAAQQLQGVGVRYLHLVDYSLPSLYNSVLQEISARPDLSRYEYGFGMTQVYSLRDSGLREGPAVDITPGKVRWTRTPMIRIGGKKVFGAFTLRSRVVNTQESSVSTFPLFHRDYSVELATTVGGNPAGSAENRPIFNVDPNLEYLLRLQLEGRGFVRIWLHQFDADGRAVDNEMIERSRPIRIGELALTEQYPQRNFSRRFKPLPQTKFLRLAVEHVGQSHLTVNRATITALVAPAE